MQWTPGSEAGFTSGKPWLPVNKNSKWRNVETEGQTKDSHMSVFKALAALRKRPSFSNNKDMRTVLVRQHLYAFSRGKDDMYVVAVDLRPKSPGKTVTYDLTEDGFCPGAKGVVEVSSVGAVPEGSTLKLKGRPAAARSGRRAQN